MLFHWEVIFSDFFFFFCFQKRIAVEMKFRKVMYNLLHNERNILGDGFQRVQQSILGKGS